MNRRVVEVWVRVPSVTDDPVSLMARRYVVEERAYGVGVWRRLPDVYATRADAERAKEAMS